MLHTKLIGRIAHDMFIAHFSGMNLHANAAPPTWCKTAAHLPFINTPDTRSSNPVIPDAFASVRSTTGPASALVNAWRLCF